MNDGDDRMNNDSENLVSSNWQGFVYHSESASHSVQPSQADHSTSSRRNSDRAAPIPENSRNSSTLYLSSQQSGDRVCIVSLNCGEANNRLMAMGLIPGAVLEVISCTATGSVIVALQDQRLGLGAEMARKIQIIHAEQALHRSENPAIPGVSTLQTDSPLSTVNHVPTVKLRDVATGTTLCVIGYEPTARDYKRKLLAMGLTPGTELRVTRHAPLGDPTEISVRGFQLSLRKAEVDALIVAPANGR